MLYVNKNEVFIAFSLLICRSTINGDEGP